MASAGKPERGREAPIPGKAPDDRAERQARLDWVLSDDDPWADLEEEPPCFCTAHLVHRSFDAVRAHLAEAYPELLPVREEASPPSVDLEWPKESFAWPDWLEPPRSFRGAGEIHLGQRFMEVWTPTRSRMRRLLRSLMDLQDAQVEVRSLEVEDPLEELAGRLEEFGSDDLNPDPDPEALDFLIGLDDPEAGPQEEGA